jgi:hypothetical protein
MVTYADIVPSDIVIDCHLCAVVDPYPGQLRTTDRPNDGTTQDRLPSSQQGSA